jgi:hypothetical protein
VLWASVWERVMALEIGKAAGSSFLSLPMVIDNRVFEEP